MFVVGNIDYALNRHHANSVFPNYIFTRLVASKLIVQLVAVCVFFYGMYYVPEIKLRSFYLSLACAVIWGHSYLAVHCLPPSFYSQN